MRRGNSNLDAIVAQSDLAPTAVEFYPRGYDRPRRSQKSQEYRNNANEDPSNSSTQSSNEFYSRNREPKQSKGKESHRFNRSEREVVNAHTSDNRMWRDGSRRDPWYTNDHQAYRNRNDEDRARDGPSDVPTRRHNHGRGQNQPQARNFRSDQENHEPMTYVEERNGDGPYDVPQRRQNHVRVQNLPQPRSLRSNQENHDTNNEERNGGVSSEVRHRRNNHVRGRNPPQPRSFRNDSEEHEPTTRLGHNSRPDNRQYQQSGDYSASDRPSYDNGATKHFKSRNYEFQPRNRNQDYERRNRYSDSKRDESDKGRNQMEVLVAQLTKGTLECLVCCEHIRQSNSTWSCRVCHHVLHLKCVSKWAMASQADGGWHCPACRHISTNTPDKYRCFCGQTVDPTWNRSDCPHTCGGVCGQTRSGACPHKCTLQCHPGPCPTCHLYVTRECGCGKVSRTVPCSDHEPVACGDVCDKPLNCGLHKCLATCHGGECEKCDQLIQQACFCGRSAKEVPCSPDSVGIINFNCGAVCGKKLTCGNHKCTLNCHDGPCHSCALLPADTEFCPCGKMLLSQLDAVPRTSCLDPIPTCSNVCRKLLPCGEPGCRHECLSPCHEGSCPPCPKDTAVRCRCGHMNKTIGCAELLVRADDARCDKKCNKNRSCGKHKCRETCCIDMDHICPMPCNRQLSCGLHRCEAQCHTGYCRPCTRDSFQELTCECGAEVIFPPVPCGTRRPTCNRPCTRARTCSHPTDHSCHDGDVYDCPPCIVLVSKSCYGGHELRKAVLCHLEGFSCGIACGQPLPCGRHACLLPCHEGSCLQAGQACVQPCAVTRASCGHPCAAPCHEPPCPDVACKEVVKVTCECGLRFASRSCVDNARDYQRIATVQLASKMADLAAGGTVDLSPVAGGKKVSFKTLECNEECKLVERNRRLAVGLQIRNPDLSSKLTPKYSEFLRQFAKRDAYFCQMVHDKLTDLVQLAKQSKQKSRSYSFDSMNRDKRQFVHEYCEHFGCESVAYDQEPNRNVVATATRDKSWLPGLSLLEVIQRESGARKVPLPSNTKSRLIPSMRSMEVLPKRTAGAAGTAWTSPASPGQSSWREVPSTAPPPPPSGPILDYFDMTSS